MRGVCVIFILRAVRSCDGGDRVPPSIRLGSRRSLLLTSLTEHHLYLKVAEYLRANPTDERSPLRMKIPGVPAPDGPLPPPAAPRGWKMGTVLPLHSAAVTGGGVSENLFKDMMADMQGQEREQSPAGGKKKKDKKVKGGG